MVLASRQQFSPLCDLHHTSMRRLMLEEQPEQISSYHACDRRGCTRVYRDSNGYLDLIGGDFDDSRASVRNCPVCDAGLYLAEVDHLQKIEIWECPSAGCDVSQESRSPSGR